MGIGLRMCGFFSAALGSLTLTGTALLANKCPVIVKNLNDAVQSFLGSKIRFSNVSTEIEVPPLPPPFPPIGPIEASSNICFPVSDVLDLKNFLEFGIFILDNACPITVIAGGLLICNTIGLLYLLAMLKEKEEQRGSLLDEELLTNSPRI